MAFNISTSIVINATPDQVWQQLSDFETYKEWNPFIFKVEGTVQKGEKINIEIDGMKFKPKVLEFSVNHKLEWLGHLLFPGLFDGQHSFELVDNGDGTTTFIQSEVFKGILVPLLRKKMSTETVDGFNAMNEALKKRVEQHANR